MKKPFTIKLNSITQIRINKWNCLYSIHFTYSENQAIGENSVYVSGL